MDIDVLKTKLQEEVRCSICLEYYIDPILLDCGHTFCHSCINRCWMEYPGEPACPQCRKAIPSKNSRPNRVLANVVEILKQLNSQEEEESGDKICRKHPEPSEVVFCKEDQVSLCLLCEGSEQHRNHRVVPLKEAAQEYKDSFRSCIVALQNEKKEIVKHKINAIRENEELMKCLEKEKQNTLTEIRQLQQFLANQDSLLLAKIQTVARDLVNTKNEQLCKLSAELFTIQNTVQRLEEKCQQPDNKLLQDAEKTLERCEKRPKFHPLEAVPLELKWRTCELQDLNVLLDNVAKHFKSTLENGYQPQHVEVTFDPESAHPQLEVSSDGKSLRWTVTEQDVPNTDKRFDGHYSVVGLQEFTAGRHFWDIDVEGEADWAVGVATSSADRKGLTPFSSETGFFAVQCAPKRFRFPGVPERNEELKRIRVLLNCAGGQVVFYNAETLKKIYSFTHASIHRETFQPFFWLRGEGQLFLYSN